MAARDYICGPKRKRVMAGYSLPSGSIVVVCLCYMPVLDIIVFVKAKQILPFLFNRPRRPVII